MPRIEMTGVSVALFKGRTNGTASCIRVDLVRVVAGYHMGTPMESSAMDVDPAFFASSN